MTAAVDRQSAGMARGDPKASPAVRGHGGFRPDIEGLRALAVLPILFNHAQMRGFSGGFIGVDIFFVISGFLITGILARDVAAGRYSIAGFYRRRVLRIFPALMAMLAVTTLVAVVAMTPSELVAYGRSLVATILFSSNIQFYGDTGYFTAAAITRPLLHTWSLAVEEQFYLFWPLLIAWSVRRGHRTLTIVGGLSLLSLILSIWMVRVDMTAAFYLIPFRTWELGLGGLLALGMPRLARPLPRWFAEALALAGLVAILWCVRHFKEPLEFPGLNALPGCLGTAAIIAGGPATIVARLLSLRPVRFIGLISYSLYLWHWPIIVFTRIWLFQPIEGVAMWADIAISIVVAALSYRFIEIAGRKPFEALPTRRVLWIAAGVMAAGLAVGATILAGRGFPGRFDPDRVAIARVLDRNQEDAYRRGTCFMLDSDRFDARDCLSRQRPGPTILLLGDSTAAHLWPGFATEAGKYDVRQATMIGCPPQLHGAVAQLKCNRFFNQMLTRWIPANRPDAVMLAGNWMPEDVPLMRATLADLRARGQRAILVGPMPRYTVALPRLLFFGAAADHADRVAASLDPAIWGIDDGLRAAARDYGAAYISPIALLCEHHRCQVMAAPDVPMQFDQVHLTTEGSRLLVGRMMPLIDTALARR